MASPTRMADLGIDRWASGDRLQLALELWESLGEERPPLGLTSAQRKELSDRDAELDADPGLGLSWDQIRRSFEGGR